MMDLWTKRFRFWAAAAPALLVLLPCHVSADIISGNLDAGKTVLVMTGTWDDGTTEMKVCLKRASSYALSNLAGTWGLNNLASGLGAPWWLRGTLTIDAAGHYSMSAVDNANEPDNGSGAMSLLLDSFGYAIDGVPAGEFRMDADKTVVVGTSTWSSYMAGTTEIPILVKRAASYSTPDMDGTWQDHTLASGPAAPNWERGTFTITNGAFTYSKVESDGDTGFGSGIMNITPAGVMTIQDDPEPFQCYMDAGKTVVACTNTWVTNNSHNGTTSMSVGVKRAASYSQSDLAGTWYCNSLATGQGVSWWERALVTINADGTFSGSTTDSDGETGPVSGAMHLSSRGQVTPMMPGQYLVTVNASGIGGGGLVSSDGGVFFTYPADNDGFTAFASGAALTLTATADNSSVVAWSGDCASTGGSPTVATCTASTSTGDKSISALFSLKPVRIAETMAYFTSIQGASDAAANNQTVQIQAATFHEDLVLANPNAVFIKGGYNSDFSAGSNWSTIDGTVTISGGPVTFDQIEI